MARDQQAKSDLPPGRKRVEEAMERISAHRREEWRLNFRSTYATMHTSLREAWAFETADALDEYHDELEDRAAQE